METLHLIISTSDQPETLRLIANALVEQNLAACVQISGPLTSVYRWDGQVTQSTEWALQAKTIEPLVQRVKAVISSLHNYDLPEMISFPVSAEEKYRLWVIEQTSASIQN